MSILYITYSLNALIILALPIALGVYITRKFDQYWRLWWLGALALLLPQFGLLPFSDLISNTVLASANTSTVFSSAAILLISAVTYGIGIALAEEFIRYAILRWVAKDARSWVDGLLFGVGNGGAVAFFVGYVVLSNFVQMILVRSYDLTKITTPEALPYVQSQINSFWSAPWYLSLVDAFQMLFSFPVQVLMALLVMQCFTRRQGYWFFAAVGFQALFEASQVVVRNIFSNAIAVNLLIAVFGILSIWLIFLLRPRGPAQELAPNPSNA